MKEADDWEQKDISCVDWHLYVSTKGDAVDDVSVCDEEGAECQPNGLDAVL